MYSVRCDDLAAPVDLVRSYTHHQPRNQFSSFLSLYLFMVLCNFSFYSVRTWSQYNTLDPTLCRCANATTVTGPQCTELICQEKINTHSSSSSGTANDELFSTRTNEQKKKRNNITTFFFVFTSNQLHRFFAQNESKFTFYSNEVFFFLFFNEKGTFEASVLCDELTMKNVQSPAKFRFIDFSAFANKFVGDFFSLFFTSLRRFM